MAGESAAVAASGGGGAWVLPGERISRGSEETAGVGVFEEEGELFASVSGLVTRLPTEERVVVCVQRVGAGVGVAPKVGDVVTGCVSRISRRGAEVEIVSVGGTRLRQAFRGEVRKENVRAVDVDRVQIEESFRPGDWIVAQVGSLGDTRNLTLSTAKPHLGVILATSAAGATLIPLAHNRMKCPRTGAIERRKVADVLKDALYAKETKPEDGEEEEGEM